jgi:hypothetical protein
MHARDAVVCVQCGDTIDSTKPGCAQRVRGWRVVRAGGGANMIALPEPEAEWLCRFCLARRRKGLSWNQMALPLDGS